MVSPVPPLSYFSHYFSLFPLCSFSLAEQREVMKGQKEKEHKGTERSEEKKLSCLLLFERSKKGAG